MAVIAEHCNLFFHSSFIPTLLLQMRLFATQSEYADRLAAAVRIANYTQAQHFALTINTFNCMRIDIGYIYDVVIDPSSLVSYH